MINIEFVDLTNGECTFPNQRLGMVLAQPHLPKESLTEQEPFQLNVEAKTKHLETLKETLSVASQAREDGVRTHFTIFPEYWIPGLAGVQLIDTKVRSSSWPNNTVLIGGIDGLTRDQYREIVERESTHVSERNSPDRIGSSKWINCAMIWIKLADGRLEKWIQPKISPAWEEANSSHERMFEGRSIYVFKGKFENGGYFLFCNLICFDWIARVGNRNTFEWLLEGIHNQAGDGRLSLAWIFVIQRNKKPSHQTFLDSIQNFFSCDRYPNAEKQETCLVLVNTAGKSVPGRSREFGSSSMVYSPHVPFVSPDCPLTFSTGGPNFRDGNSTLRVYQLKDVVFRERGACIHSLVQNTPGSVGYGAANRTAALEDAKVFPISGNVEARAPRDAVPASTKWLHDELDDMSAIYPPCQSAIGGEIKKSRDRVVRDLRKLSSQDTLKKMKLALNGIVKCADEWDAEAAKGLRHVVRTLGVLGTTYDLRVIGSDSFHAKTVLCGQQTDVVAVRAKTHKDCEEHLRTIDVRNPSRHLLLISRDNENTLRHERDGSILEWHSSSVGQEPKITDPRGFVLGYQNLWSVVQGASNVDDIATGIHERLCY